jgi:hypothetical protein
LKNLSSVFVLAIVVSACATPTVLHPFSTDGCSVFPNHSLIGKADWCSCCLKHDLAYWRGGTDKERLDADRELKACVLGVTGNDALANSMYLGVRVGGGPYFFTPYRWGYGWSYGRLYTPLTSSEQAIAAKFESDYLASNPTLSCPK